MSESICLNIKKIIEETENEHHIRCSHVNSDLHICLQLSYNLWLLGIQEKNTCQNKSKNIKLLT
jgi:hypothetical protein